MNSCIFAAHCIENMCDKSCPIFTETSYLLERNGLNMNNIVFNTDSSDIDKSLQLLDSKKGRLGVVIVKDDTTARIANLLTYCGICKHWQGSRLSCKVYNLKFSNHIDSIQKSWNVKTSDDSIEYQQIWCQTAEVLIISNIDFVQFKDYQSQVLLNMVQNRINENLTTIIVSPPLSNLIGSGAFFNRMNQVFSQSTIDW